MIVINFVNHHIMWRKTSSQTLFKRGSAISKAVNFMKLKLAAWSCEVFPRNCMVQNWNLCLSLEITTFPETRSHGVRGVYIFIVFLFVWQIFCSLQICNYIYPGYRWDAFWSLASTHTFVCPNFTSSYLWIVITYETWSHFDNCHNVHSKPLVLFEIFNKRLSL